MLRTLNLTRANLMKVSTARMCTAKQATDAVHNHYVHLNIKVKIVREFFESVYFRKKRLCTDCSLLRKNVYVLIVACAASLFRRKNTIRNDQTFCT